MRKSTLTKFSGLLSLLIFQQFVFAANYFPNLKTNAFNVSGATASTVPLFDVGKNLVSSSVTSTQLSLLSSATNANTPSTLVQRDGSGNFSAGTITAALSGNASTATTLSGVLGVSLGGTGSDLSATGGTSRVLKQVTTGAAVTVAQLACSDLSGVATSCSTDATNASNISSGTLNTARLPTPMQLGDGSTTTPAYSFSNETNTGFYRAGANDIIHQVAGIQDMEWLKVGSQINFAYGPSGTVSGATANPVQFQSSLNGIQYFQFNNASIGSSSQTIFEILNGSASLNNSTEIGNAAYLTSGYNSGGSWLASTAFQTQLVLAATGSSAPIRFVTGGAMATGTERMTLTNTALTLNAGTSLVANGSSSGAITLSSGATPSTYTFTLPSSGGTSGYALTTNGSGTTTWTSVATNPMTTGGDIIYGGASGVPTRLANGSSGQYLKSSGGTAAPAWQSFTQPTIQRFTSGSGTYTTPAGVVRLVIEIWGGGGGGGSGGTSGGGNGTNGTDTTFGTNTAGGGVGGIARAGGGGGGGTASPGVGWTTIISVNGGSGGSGFGTNTNLIFATGGVGGNSSLGGGGKSGINSTAGTAGAANTGAGGGGGGCTVAASGCNGGDGGGSGAYVKMQINSPAATYSYAVGPGNAGGGAPTNGSGGGSGGSGLAVVTEHYF